MPYYVKLDDLTLIKYNALPSKPKRFKRSQMTFQEMVDVSDQLTDMGFIRPKEPRHHWWEAMTKEEQKEYLRKQKIERDK